VGLAPPKYRLRKTYPRNVAQIFKTAETAEVAETALPHVFKGSMAVLVVLRAPLRIAQNGVSFVDRLKNFSSASGSWLTSG